MGKLDSLQGLRFLGFFLIFLNHAGWLLWKTKYFDFGARGVEIFFVLSGFLVAYNYRDADFACDLKSSFKYMWLSCRSSMCFICLLFLWFSATWSAMDSSIPTEFMDLSVMYS